MIIEIAESDRIVDYVLACATRVLVLVRWSEPFRKCAFLSERIMSDQATELRLLARQMQRPIPTGFSPQIVLFCSGKGGTGVTSCAVNVAQALTERGQRVLLMDGAWERADISTLMNLLCKIPGPRFWPASEHCTSALCQSRLGCMSCLV